MTYTPPTPPPQGPPPPVPVPVTSGGSDRTTLWGVIGIVTGLCCCGLLGLVFGYLSMQDAKKYGKSPVLGYIAMAIGVVGIVWNIIAATRYFNAPGR